MRPARRTIALVLLAAMTLATGCVTIGLGETIEQLLAQIKALLDGRRWDEALTKIAEVIKRDPTQWKAYLYGAQAYIGKADWGQALVNARQAFQMAPREGEVLTTLGESLWGAGTEALQRRAFGDAVNHFVEYVRLRPTDWRGYLSAGRAYLGAGSWGDALRMLTDGVGRATDPGARTQFTQALLDGGRQALSRADYRGAIGLLREGVRLEPGNVSALLDLGKAYWNGGERGEALGAFRRVLELAPQNEEARNFLLGR
jgi:Flp pilus assembly protein TadD